MRGAGSSFGLLTSLTLVTHLAPRVVIAFKIDYKFPNPNLAAITFHHFQHWAHDSAPPELGIRWTQSLEKIPNSQTHLILGRLQGQFYGHYGRYKKVINTLTRGFGVKSTSEDIQRLSWIESVKDLAGSNDLSSIGINPSVKVSFHASRSSLLDTDRFREPRGGG